MQQTRKREPDRIGSGHDVGTYKRVLGPEHLCKNSLYLVAGFIKEAITVDLRKIRIGHAVVNERL